MKTKTLYIYYFVLFFVLAVWNGTNSLPMLVRLLYLGLIVLPLIKRSDFIPAVFACSLTLSYNFFTTPILPTEAFYYIAILGGLAFLSIKSGRIKALLFVASIAYVFVIDIVTQGQTSPLFIRMLICLLASFCVRDKMDKCRTPLEVSFMFCSIVLSYWTLFRMDARIKSIHIVEGLNETAGWTDPNYLGCIIGLGCIIAIKEILSTNGRAIPRVFSFFTLVLSLFALAYLASRGAILAFAVSSVALFSFSKTTNNKSKAFFVVAMSVLIFIMYRSSSFEALSARFESESLATGSGRIEIWTKKLSSFLNEGNIFNLLFGFGQEKGLDLGGFGRARAFHNDFIAFLVEYGVCGFLLFLVVLTYPIRKASPSIRKTIIGFVSFIVVAGMTLEPISSDMPSSIAFTFFMLYMITESKLDNVLIRRSK